MDGILKDILGGPKHLLILTKFLFGLFVSSFFVFGVLGRIASIFSPATLIEFPQEIETSLIIFGIIFLTSIFLGLLEWFQNFLKRGSKFFRYDFNNWPDDWIFSGRPETENGILKMKLSRAGALISTPIWKNFKLSFDLKFDTQISDGNYLGVVFRAKDLDNYFMFEIQANDLPINGVKPHVRYKGGWEIDGIKHINSVENLPAIKIDFSNFKHMELLVNKNEATIYYDSNKIYTWRLPTHVDVSHHEIGTATTKENGDKLFSADLFNDHVREIPFRSIYGMVGFRSYPEHNTAFIKNLEIQPF